ncbi:MarR family winged helix-turn-helix transcriptional regulator [Maribellus maritimus]|uniref:MarR family winged helix-turn-helix transcriptional regulator n=1 Tax=Maribellus maritimus TaxID=2870838 RepID=UPI001EE9B8B9|nr:MarR family transcriptional regulator [Maribellus maritimus]MCG6189508.1 MarR family transcriptional regulator [Maribellus maritimus]
MYSNKPLTYLLGQTMKLVKFKLLSKFKENNVDLNMEQFTVLIYLNQNDTLTQQDLANHFMRDKSIVLRQVNTLINLELLVRKENKNDKRKKNLKLTEKGKALLQFSQKVSREVSSELLKGVTDEELLHFENVISKIQMNTGFKECVS